MKASEILLCLDSARLTVFKINSEGIGVHYECCDVKDGCCLVGVFGVGNDFESACEDYLSKIRGKTLVFNAEKQTRKEVTVLG